MVFCLRISSLTFALLFLAPRSFASLYSIVDDIVGDKFYSSFTFDAIADPTHGRVEYVDRNTAVANNLSYTTIRNTFVMRADHTTVLNPSGPGRKSIRIESKKAYSTHVVIFDVLHMPQGCATWPAAWESDTSNWPNSGEVDIIEGANDQTPNLMSLHTSPGCTMPNHSDQTGTFKTTNCDATVAGNAGCGVNAPDAVSYGPPFNSNGGGWYALERTEDFFKVWFWPRNEITPWDVSNSSPIVIPEHWGTPVAYFPNKFCDLAKKFGPNNIIINLTLCGDWAGATYASNGCPGTCVNYVNNHPERFVDAFWEIASVRVYEPLL